MGTTGLRRPGGGPRLVSWNCGTLIGQKAAEANLSFHDDGASTGKVKARQAPDMVNKD
jgi:hypothetical protein